MADVGDERGQLVLLTAISIAALLVLVAVLLSSLVYTENVATRDETGVDTRAAQLHRVAAVEAVGDLTERANREGLTEAEFRASVAAWDAQQARHAAATGASASVSLRSVTNATLIGQTNETRNFTNVSEEGTWTLATDVTDASEWTLTVDESSLVAGGIDENATTLADAGAFRVVVIGADTGETRQLFLYRKSGTVVAYVDPGTTGSPIACEAITDANGTVTVDMSARTASTTPCPELGALDTWTEPYHIEYRDGENATGTYSLLVDRPVDAVADGDVSMDISASPFAVTHLSDVRIDVTYTTADLRYRVWNLTVAEEVAP